MIKQNCIICNNSLVSASEQKSSACLACYPAIISQFISLKNECEKNKIEISNLNVSLTEYKERNEAYISALQEEMTGIEACKRGALENDNPYDVNSTKFNHWKLGWASENHFSELEKFKSLLVFILDNLFHVYELSSGYGHDEISAKLKTIIEKANCYIDEK